MPEQRRDGWHRRAHFALRHSLRLKLIVAFLLLAFGLSVIFLAGTQRAIGVGWRLAVAPLVADYVDRLAADIGTPPSIERAAELTRTLPVSVRIDGPVVRWRSHAEQDGREWAHGEGRWHDESPRLLERMTADGHRITLGLGDLSWKSQPRLIGWSAMVVLLLVIALAYAYVRRLLRPLDDIRTGVQRFGSGAFGQPITIRRRDELGDLAQRINTMAHDLQRMLDGKRALLLAISHELRSPLTRARLNAELLPETADAGNARSALLRDLAEMRDLINDLLESERLSDAHAALNRESVDLCALVRSLVEARPDWQVLRLKLPDGLPPLAADPQSGRQRHAPWRGRAGARTGGPGGRPWPVRAGARPRAGRGARATGAPGRGLLPDRQGAPAHYRRRRPGPAPHADGGPGARRDTHVSQCESGAGGGSRFATGGLIARPSVAMVLVPATCPIACTRNPAGW